MRKKVNVFLLCVLLGVCMIAGSIPAVAKQDVMQYVSYGSDADLGALTVGEKVDIDISQKVDYDKFYSKWTNTDSFPEPYWTSSNSNIASVDKYGVVTAKSVGNAVIFATFQYSGAAPVQLKFAVSVISSKNQVEYVRYNGRNRFLTANVISDAGWGKTGCKTVVLANSNSYADALVGVPLAVALDAPILLTAGGATLEPDVLGQIKKLEATDIVILGGNIVVSPEIENFLKSNHYNVVRCSGKSRYKTAIEIAKYTEQVTGKKAESAFIATSAGYADALSISPYAAMQGYPVLYVDKNMGNNQDTFNYIDERGYATLTLLGGESAITQEVESTAKAKVNQVKRIFGSNRYETSVEIAKTYLDAFSNDVMLATGLNFPDALAGGVLAAKNRTPVLLINNISVPPVIETFIRTRNPEKIYILGGELVIPQNVIESMYK